MATTKALELAQLADSISVNANGEITNIGTLSSLDISGQIDTSTLTVGANAQLQVFADANDYAYLKTSSRLYLQNQAGTATFLRGNIDGVRIYYGNDYKLTTTSTGINVIGTTETDSLSVTDTTASSNTTTGALTVAGGIGVAGAVRASQVSVTNIVTDRLVKFNGTIFDDAILSDDGTTATVSGNLTVSGDFLVSGNTSTINADNLLIEDLNITLANGAANSAVADGAGITIDGANAQITYRSSADDLAFNKAILSPEGYFISSGPAPAGIDFYSVNSNINDGLQVKSWGSVHVILDTDNNDSDTRLFTINKNGTNRGNSTELFRVNEAGYVGIGYSDPYTKLTLTNGVGRTSTTKIYFSAFQSEDADDYRAGLFTAITGGETAADRYFHLDTGAYRLSTGSIANSGESLLLQSLGGQVGIGDVNPRTKLTVDGGINFGTRSTSIFDNTGPSREVRKIYELHFQSINAYANNNTKVMVLASGSTNSRMEYAEFFISFKQQNASDQFEIYPKSRHNMEIYYKFDATGGTYSAGILEIWAKPSDNYQTIAVFPEAIFEQEDNEILGIWQATGLGTDVVPSGTTRLQFPVSDGLLRYSEAGRDNNTLTYSLLDDVDDGEGVIGYRVESYGYSSSYTPSDTRLVVNGGTTATSTISGVGYQLTYVNNDGARGVYVSNGGVLGRVKIGDAVTITGTSNGTKYVASIVDDNNFTVDTNWTQSFSGVSALIESGGLELKDSGENGGIKINGAGKTIVGGDLQYNTGAGSGNGAGHRLTISDTYILAGGPSNADHFYLRQQGTAGEYAIQTTVSGGNIGALQLQPYGGLVGIKTTNPTQELTVNGNTELLSNNGSYSEMRRFSWRNENSTGFEIANITAHTGANIYEGEIAFNTKDSGGTFNEGLRLDSSANVKLSGYQYVNSGTKNSSPSYAAGDWVSIAEIPYGEVLGIIGIEWNSVTTNAAAHHGYARLKVGAYYNRYYYGWETTLELLDHTAHNSFYFEEYRVVRPAGYSNGDPMLLQAKTATIVQAGSFKVWQETRLGPNNTDITLLNPVTDNTPNGTVQASILTDAQTKKAVFGKMTVNGTFSATSKSFDIEHPTKEGMRLHHGSLEGPEHGVYVRGRLTNSNIIELPDYWEGLVDLDTITVQLTAVGGKQDLWVSEIVGTTIMVGCEGPANCFYFVQAERKDIDKFDVEYEV